MAPAVVRSNLTVTAVPRSWKINFAMVFFAWLIQTSIYVNKSNIEYFNQHVEGRKL